MLYAVDESNSRLQQEDQDEYKFQEEDEDEDQFEDDESTPAREDLPTNRGRRANTRRSTRSTAANGSNDDWADWRGERRSTRLGAPAETQLDGPQPKRARTDDSTTTSVDTPAATGGNNIKLKVNGAAAVRPTETVVETVAGKKKSKFWVYAVEPLAAPESHPPSTDYEMSDSTLPQHSAYSEDTSSAGARVGGESEEGSLRDGESGSASMDES